MPARILLVEDDPVSLEGLAALLRARGYAVAEATDGFGALRCAQEAPFDLVFVDYHLPEMDGYALARMMRTLGEKSGARLAMVAITADSFGLAARRGADSVFDRILSKPIDPDVLYAFCDEFLANVPESVEDFLAEPKDDKARGAANVLWRVRGLVDRPRAVVFPEPTADERKSLEYCFRIVPAAQADCLVLLRQSGLREVEELRARGDAFLQPLLVIDAGHAAIGDALFTVVDGESWTTAASTITGFRDRRAAVRPDILASADFQTRLAAYLFVAARPLLLRRDPLGHTSVPYTAGFAAADVLTAVRQLAASGLVVATPSHGGGDGVRELALNLTEAGLKHIALPDIGQRASAAGDGKLPAW